MALQPFSVEWPAEGQFPADVSFLLQVPAGKAGFIRTKDGHIVLPDGARFRIWGLNATMQAGRAGIECAHDFKIFARRFEIRRTNQRIHREASDDRWMGHGFIWCFVFRLRI